MSSDPDVLLIFTSDTKHEEGQYLRERLENTGLNVIHMDTSIRLLGESIGDITPEQVAQCAGTTLQAIRDLKHEGKCLEQMIGGAITCANKLHADVGLSGVIAIGGSMGTTLGSAVMQSLPFGLPKIMVSTMASGLTTPFVGTKDVVMFPSVVDIAGLNVVTRQVMNNAANALAGMAHAYRATPEVEKPLVLISTLGVTEACSREVRRALEQRGFEVMIFHTLGTGGRVLDEIAAEQDVAVVVDMSLVEINDLLNNGLCSAGPDRCRAAIRKGIPTIFAPGNADFIVAGPYETDAKQRFPDKRYHIHNAALTAIRTDEPELKRLAEHMADVISEGDGPVSFYVPLQGFSSHDSPHGYLQDTSLPPVFAAYLRQAVPERAELHEIDAHINDDAFAAALVSQVLKYSKELPTQ